MPDAPVIGTYRDRPILEWREWDGIRYRYDRPAMEDADGVRLAQLRTDEVLVAPGLVYRRAE